MLTCDRKNRYRDLEKKAVLQSKVRQYLFAGNLGGEQMAALLVKMYPAMREYARTHERPFIASVSKNGDIYTVLDKDGKNTK
jgi:hypothetical protein